MTRLVRLNEVQYAATEEQAAALIAQGFEAAPLPVEPPKTPQEPKEDKPAKDGKAKGKKAESDGKEDAPPKGDEQH